MKTILAISRGIWLVKLSWAQTCWNNGSWVSELEYEAHEWFTGAKKARLQKASGKDLLFTNLTFFIGTKTNFPEDVLQQVLKNLGGKISTNIESVDYCISGFSQIPQVANLKGAAPVIVKETWIFDALTEWCIPDPKDYAPEY